MLALEHADPAERERDQRHEARLDDRPFLAARAPSRGASSSPWPRWIRSPAIAAHVCASQSTSIVAATSSVICFDETSASRSAPISAVATIEP